jgi:hypothetical protein
MQAAVSPEKLHCIVVTCLDREPGLENAECSGTLCPDGLKKSPNLRNH